MCCLVPIGCSRPGSPVLVAPLPPFSVRRLEAKRRGCQRPTRPAPSAQASSAPCSLAWVQQALQASGSSAERPLLSLVQCVFFFLCSTAVSRPTMCSFSVSSRREFLRLLFFFDSGPFELRFDIRFFFRQSSIDSTNLCKYSRHQLA